MGLGLGMRATCFVRSTLLQLSIIVVDVITSTYIQLHPKAGALEERGTEKRKNPEGGLPKRTGASPKGGWMEGRQKGIMISLVSLFCTYYRTCLPQLATSENENDVAGLSELWKTWNQNHHRLCRPHEHTRFSEGFQQYL